MTIFRSDSKMFTLDQKHAYLESIGFKIGERDPKGINTDFPGQYMVAEEYEPSELPTRDGSNGPWCVVGDDLTALIDEAFNVWFDESVKWEVNRYAVAMNGEVVGSFRYLNHADDFAYILANDRQHPDDVSVHRIEQFTLRPMIYRYCDTSEGLGRECHNLFEKFRPFLRDEFDALVSKDQKTQ